LNVEIFENLVLIENIQEEEKEDEINKSEN